VAKRFGVSGAYAGYRAGSMVARALPRRFVGPATRAGAVVAAGLMGGRRRIVERNLVRATGRRLEPAELDRLVRATFASYVRYWIESFRLPGTSAAALAAGIDEEAVGHLWAGLDAGKGVVLALPHLGGWEWAAFWLAEVKHQPVTAVVEPVEPPELANWFVGLREKFGIEVVPLGDGAVNACMRTLRENRILCLLSDRDIGGGGVAVKFFGETTTLPAGPATLALRTGAALVPAAVYFDGEGHRAVTLPALDTTRQGRLRADVDRITQDLACALEELIREAPEQWHLMQPNWPSDREIDVADGTGAGA
jgi:phosphatidylinositol dimannoside acyltransferase